jgi:hypothetical protein
MHRSDEGPVNDLELFENSCRRLANRCRNDARGSNWTAFTDSKLAEAAEWEHMAESVKRSRLGSG